MFELEHHVNYVVEQEQKFSFRLEANKSLLRFEDNSDIKRQYKVNSLGKQDDVNCDSGGCRRSVLLLSWRKRVEEAIKKVLKQFSSRQGATVLTQTALIVQS